MWLLYSWPRSNCKKLGECNDLVQQSPKCASECANEFWELWIWAKGNILNMGLFDCLMPSYTFTVSSLKVQALIGRSFLGSPRGMKPLQPISRSFFFPEKYSLPNWRYCLHAKPVFTTELWVMHYHCVMCQAFNYSFVSWTGLSHKSWNTKQIVGFLRYIKPK